MGRVQTVFEALQYQGATVDCVIDRGRRHIEKGQGKLRTVVNNWHASAPPRLDDGHVSSHNGAEILAHIIVSRRLGFDTTHLVRGSRHDTILPWLGVPDIRPPPP